MSTGLYLVDLRRLEGIDTVKPIEIAENLADFYGVSEDLIDVTEMSGPPIS